MKSICQPPLFLPFTLNPPPLPPLHSRRALLSLLASFLFPLPPLATTPRPHAAATLIRSRCAPFLSLLRPLSSSTLLWRGSITTPSASFRVVRPRPDLLDEATYGAGGAAFFRQMEDSGGCVRPSRAHIGTGSKTRAAEWGVPVCVWPVGRGVYGWSEDGGLIYEEGVGGGGMVCGQKVRDVLRGGGELMFECEEFVEVGEDIVWEVLEELGLGM